MPVQVKQPGAIATGAKKVGDVLHTGWRAMHPAQVIWGWPAKALSKKYPDSKLAQAAAKGYDHWENGLGKLWYTGLGGLSALGAINEQRAMRSNPVYSGGDGVESGKKFLYPGRTIFGPEVKSTAEGANNFFNHYIKPTESWWHHLLNSQYYTGENFWAGSFDVRNFLLPRLADIHNKSQALTNASAGSSGRALATMNWASKAQDQGKLPKQISQRTSDIAQQAMSHMTNTYGQKFIEDAVAQDPVLSAMFEQGNAGNSTMKYLATKRLAEKLQILQEDGRLGHYADSANMSFLQDLAESQQDRSPSILSLLNPFNEDYKNAPAYQDLEELQQLVQSIPQNTTAQQLAMQNPNEYAALVQKLYGIATPSQQAKLQSAAKQLLNTTPSGKTNKFGVSLPGMRF